MSAAGDVERLVEGANKLRSAHDAVTLLQAADVLYRRIPRRFGRDVVIRSLRHWADQIGEQQ